MLRSLFLLIIFALVNAALIVIKRRHTAGHPYFSAPILVPWLGMITAGALAAINLYQLATG